ncbi:MAG TPA: T9SS type A sorting domain-containing protein [bacterium (Candidatus Stahlbacteria)]|nr:T9SS type A sorting domain-containing protein [Candidatus Stahlbacteria bacterium]
MAIILLIGSIINFSSTASQIEFEVLVSELDLTPAKDGFYSISIGEEGGLFEVGRPRMPIIRKFIEIPYGARPEAEVVSITSEVITIDGKVLPVQPPRPKIPGVSVPFTFDRVFYSKDQLYPAQVVRITNEAVIRGHRVITVEIAPVQYNPKRAQLIFNKEIKVRVDLPGSDLNLTGYKVNRYHSFAFDPVLDGLILNYNAYSFSPPPDLPIGYLIIVPDAWASYLDPLVEWRKKKGYHVTVAKKSETGSTKEQIKNYISNAYHNWPIPPSFVLLIGDIDQIPYWSGSGSGSPPTDLNYACVDGSDYFPDVDLSRFSVANSTQLDSLVKKTVKYERNEWTGGNDWCDRAYFIASKDINYHQVAENTHKWCMAIVRRHGMTADSLWLYYGTGTPVRTAVNGGRSWVTYSGHGTTTSWAEVPFGVSDVHNLTNTDKVGFVQTYACDAGDFTYGECFSESWIRVGYRGGIAHIASSVGSYWEEDDTLQRKVFDVAFDTAYYWIMGMINRGKYLYYLSFGPSSFTRRYFEMYNLMGDGSIDVYGDVPHDIVVDHPATIPVGDYDLTVTVTDNGNPVENGLVGVRPAKDDTVFAGYTDVTGQGTIPIYTSQPETVYVTVTGHNLKPYEGFCIAQSGGVEEMALGDLRFKIHTIASRIQLEYNLVREEDVEISLYDCTGKRIAYYHRPETAGHHNHTFRSRLPSGVYFLRFKAGSVDLSQKVVLIR